MDLWESFIKLLDDRMTINDYYDLNNKKRLYLSKKHRIYRNFFYNPELKAFHRKCAFCLTDLSDNTVYKYSCLKDMDGSFYRYYESHKCSCCNQKWEYFNFCTYPKQYPLVDNYTENLSVIK